MAQQDQEHFILFFFLVHLVFFLTADGSRQATLPCAPLLHRRAADLTEPAAAGRGSPSAPLIRSSTLAVRRGPSYLRRSSLLSSSPRAGRRGPSSTRRAATQPEPAVPCSPPRTSLLCRSSPRRPEPDVPRAAPPLERAAGHRPRAAPPLELAAGHRPRAAPPLELAPTRAAPRRCVDLQPRGRELLSRMPPPKTRQRWRDARQGKEG